MHCSNLEEKVEARLKRHYTLLSVTTPILMMYAAGPLPLVTWLMLFWLLEYVVYCIKLHKGVRCTINVPLLTFFSYSLLISLLHMFFGDFSDVDFTGFLNYHFCLWMALCWGTNWCDYKKGYQWIKVTSIIATVYIYLQSVLFKMTGYVLSGFIPFLQTDYMESADKVLQGVAYRPTSIFAEPAGYGVYIALFILLYINIEKEKSIGLLVFLCFGVALSKSSAGMISIAYVLLMDFLNKNLKRLINKKAIAVALISALGIIAIYQMGYINLVIDHLFEQKNGNIIMAAGLTQRIGSYSIAWKALLDSEQWLLGVGFLKNNFFFLTGNMKLLYFYGVAGTTIFMLLHTWVYNTTNLLGRKILFFAFVLSFFSNTIMGVQPIVYYPLILASNQITMRNSIAKRNTSD